MCKIIPLKNLFCLYLTVPLEHLQSKESSIVQTLQCKFFWPSVRAINHFAVRRAAFCGQHVHFLSMQRCFDDGWQSSMSGSCLLMLVIGGNISEPVGMSNSQIMEEWKMPSQCSELWARMVPLCPPPPNCHVHLPALQSSCKACALEAVCQQVG